MPLMWLYIRILASAFVGPQSANTVREMNTSDTDDPPLVGIEWFAVQGQET